MKKQLFFKYSGRIHYLENTRFVIEPTCIYFINNVFFFFVIKSTYLILYVCIFVLKMVIKKKKYIFTLKLQFRVKSYKENYILRDFTRPVVNVWPTNVASLDGTQQAYV